ncbi:MAG: hypothetical protein ACYCU7_07275 [Acidimicrobiales bacterium]
MGARRAVVVAAAMPAAVTPWVVYAGAFSDRNFLRLSDGATTVPPLPGTFSTLYLPGAVGVAAEILLIVWTYRAAVHARRLGLVAAVDGSLAEATDRLVGGGGSSGPRR